jgi:molybdopterin-guanine dinucleotide biosynthesis protein A
MAKSISILRPAGRFPPTLGLLVAATPAVAFATTHPALLRIGGETVLQRVRARVGPHCAGMLIVTDDDPALFAASGLPVVGVARCDGPFDGVRAGLDWLAAHMPALDWAVGIPADAPFLPEDLLGRLHAAQAVTRAELVCASAGGSSIPEVALVRAGARLPTALPAEAQAVEWPSKPFDPFLRVRSLDAIAQAEAIAAQLARLRQ